MRAAILDIASSANVIVYDRQAREVIIPQPMSSRYDSLIQDLREYSQRGHSVTEVIWRLYSQLQEVRGQISGYTFTALLHRAFDLDYEVVLEVRHWAELGWGGTISDDELERMAGQLVPRSRDLYSPDQQNGP
jgi:hypothetical protein